jgi:hypothetical protein
MEGVLELETDLNPNTAYEDYEQKRNRLQYEALGKYAFLIKQMNSGQAAAVRFNTLHEAAHATPWLVLVSMPDEAHHDIRRFRNILVHTPDAPTRITADVFDRLAEVLKSFRDASMVSSTPDFAAVWKKTDAAETYWPNTLATQRFSRRMKSESGTTKRTNDGTLVDKDIDERLLQPRKTSSTTCRSKSFIPL